MTRVEKSILDRRREQFIYWSSIGMDMAIPRENSGVYVLGFVKSGTNWLCHLLSTALNMPILEPWQLHCPTIRPHIYHLHRFIPLDAIRNRTIYLIRDGRDTMISKYFHVVREGGPLKARLEKYLGRPLHAEEISENMSKFILFMQKNRVASVDYRSHLQKWKRQSDKYITMRYEDLLADPVSELTRAIEQLPGHNASREMIRMAVIKHDFSRLTKRARGQEDLTSFIRKGISGDWRNYFTQEAAKTYDEYAGDILIELGYEKNRDWWITL